MQSYVFPIILGKLVGYLYRIHIRLYSTTHYSVHR